jgi:hypothetical protein
MKKILITLFAAALLFPGSSFAETWTVGNTDGADSEKGVYLGDESGELFRVSTNVVLKIDSDSDDYAVTSGHLQGTRQYGTTSRFNEIFEGKKEKGEEPDPPADNTTLDDTVFEDFPTDETGSST